MARIALGIVISIMVLSGTARADKNHVSVRGGITDDPDSLFIGIAMMAGAHGRGVRIQPGLDFGIGDIGDFDFFSLRGSANVLYAVPLSGRGRYIYPLVGATVYYINFDDCDNCSETEIGINVGGGIEVSGVQIELVAGLDGDDDLVPDIALQVGVTL